MQSSIEPGCVIAYPLTDSLYALAVVLSVERDSITIEPFDESETVRIKASTAWRILSKKPW